MPTAGSGSSISSSAATRRSTPAICSSEGRWKSKRWQRSTIVAGTLCASVVASTNTTCGGGSSSVFRNAFHADGREHVGLVEDVHAPPALHRRQRHVLAQLADVVDRVVGRGVHLDHVERGAGEDRLGGGILGVELHPRPAGRVERAGQQLGHRGLARAPRAHEQVGVVHLVQLDRVAKRADDGLLADHLVEGLGAVAAVEGEHAATHASRTGGRRFSSRRARRGRSCRNAARRRRCGGCRAPPRVSRTRNARRAHPPARPERPPTSAAPRPRSRTRRWPP